MSCSRRDFLKQACGGTLASVLPVSAFTFLTNEEARAAVENANVRWAFLVDTRKCVGCGLCVKACKNENEIPYDAPVTRTWVEHRERHPWRGDRSRQHREGIFCAEALQPVR
jgi:ferredoxin